MRIADHGKRMLRCRERSARALRRPLRRKPLTPCVEERKIVSDTRGISCLTDAQEQSQGNHSSEVGGSSLHCEA